MHNVFSKHISSNYAPNVLPANVGEEVLTQETKVEQEIKARTHDKQGWIPDLLLSTTPAMKGSTNERFGDACEIDSNG